MSARRPRLSRRLAGLVGAVLGLLWLVSMAATGLALRFEEGELFDQQLVVGAETLLPMLSAQIASGGAVVPGAASLREAPREALAWRMIDRDGRVLAASEMAARAKFPTDPAPGGFQRSATHRIYTTAFDAAGHAVQFADPMAERHEAWRVTFLSFALPMLALVPLGGLLVWGTVGLGLRPLTGLRAEMARRDSHTLAPIGTGRLPEELAAMAEAMNGFMARLGQALEGERAFASNAAHELRTPVAIALAQVQRLRAEATDPAIRARAETIEAALQRMSHLVGRLLQLARADAGVGPGEAAVDAGVLLRLVVRGLASGSARLQLTLPEAPVPVHIDADAFAIVAGNLIENALQHSPADTPVEVGLIPGPAAEPGADPGEGTGAVLCVRNAGPVVPPGELVRLTQRFVRAPGAGGAAGFGLGLCISHQIAAQAGGRLDLSSPVPGRTEGFEARLTLA
ncbi:sensor histidine kinase [Paenirhodobacter enshiensis]|uniref:sensor histidine kinase n=1 Tax=Paenirhodobacter enshiensis TaxID=1105367 RepID=UPI003FA232FA